MGYDRIGSLHSHNDSGREEQQLGKSEPMIRLPETPANDGCFCPPCRVASKARGQIVAEKSREGVWVVSASKE
jgi:hypothetical protein